MSTSAITSNAGQAAISAMKTGSGIDIQSLATDLTNATKAASQSSIDTRRAAAQAQISSVAKVMSAVDLCNKHPGASEGEIRELLEGNICRCTGYQNIVKAVQQGGQAMKAAA